MFFGQVFVCKEDGESEQVWLFNFKDSCISGWFSHWFKVGGASLENGNVTYLHAPI